MEIDQGGKTMAAKRNTEWPTLNTYYVDGNTVRKSEPKSRLTYYEQETSPRKRAAEEVPARRTRAAEPARKTTPKKRPVQKPVQQPKVYREPKERTSLMTPVFAVYATVALAVVMVFALRMLAAPTALASADDQIVILESTLNEINQENTKLEALVEAGMDLEHIYEVATNELGLVATDDSQVIYYDQIESGYVRQDEIIH